MIKLEENPPIISPLLASVGSARGPWWVAHTKPRTEKALAHELISRGIPYFLPMVERVSISGGRKRRTLLPLFSSYVFFCGDANARYQALTTNRICNTLQVVEREKFVAELTELERALSCQGNLDFFPSIAIGTRCRVVSGPLMGIQGTVVRRDDQARFVLNVSMLGQGASLEIDADLLEPV